MAANELVSISVEVTNGTGTTVSKILKFKSFMLIPAGIIRKTRNDFNAQRWAVLEWACDERNLEIVDQIPSNKLDDLVTEMQKASQVDLGESERSSTSSRSTARPSKRTSSTKV